MSRKNWSNEKLLSKLLGNNTNRSYWQNIRELRKRGSLELFEICVQLSQSESEKERNVGVQVLAQLSTCDWNKLYSKEVLEFFVSRLRCENSFKVLSSILYGIGHNNEHLNSPADIELVSSFSKHRSYYVRIGTAFALFGIEDKSAIDALIVLSNDRFSTIRDWSTFGLGTQNNLDDESIRDALIARIQDKDQDTKLEAIVGLARRKDSRIKEIIIQELNDGEYGVLLFEAITELNDKDFVPILESYLEDAEKEDPINSEKLESIKCCIDLLREG